MKRRKRFAIVIGVAAVRRDRARGADGGGAHVQHEADDHRAPRAPYLRPRVFRRREEVRGWATGDPVQAAARGGSQDHRCRRSKGGANEGFGTWGLGVPKVRFLSRLTGACMPRRRPRWAMGSCRGDRSPIEVVNKG